MSTIKAGIFGFGVVAQGLYNIIRSGSETLIEIKSVVVKQRDKKRPAIHIDYSFDPAVILDDEEINLVIELTNNSSEAYELVKRALLSGKHVISANKKMLAENLGELKSLAEEKKLSLLYEASVCASIPVIRNLEDYYSGTDIRSISGILNGSSNYILTRISEGQSYSTALEAAKKAGFAEKDPSLDVDGGDAKNKLAILSAHAFGCHIDPEEIFNLGISALQTEDQNWASSRNFKIKLIARAIKQKNRVFAFVLPELLSEENAVAAVNEEKNIVLIDADYSGLQSLTGNGAGSYPTGIAVYSDIRALNDQYRYRFEKSKSRIPEFSNSASLRIYLRCPKNYDLRPFALEDIEEYSIKGNYSTLLARVKLQKLLELKTEILSKKIQVLYAGNLLPLQDKKAVKIKSNSNL